MFGMTSLITYSMFTWIPSILRDAGASDAFGGTMVGMFSVIGLVAAFGAPTLCARMANPFPVVIACAVCYLVGMGGLYFAPMAAPVVWVVVLGLGPSTFPMSLTLINLRTRSHIGSSALSGFTQASATPLPASVRSCSAFSTTCPVDTLRRSACSSSL